MRITDAEALHLRIPDVEEIADGTQDVLVVKVHTDEGLVGIGEVTSQSYVCKAVVEASRSAERRHGLLHPLAEPLCGIEPLGRALLSHQRLDLPDERRQADDFLGGVLLERRVLRALLPGGTHQPA